jgi:hypothetical protein
MSFFKNRGLASGLVLFLVFASLPSWCGNKKKNDATVIDSGIFGIFVNARRVASEKFEITQTPEMSVAKAELKLEQGKNPQIAELQLSPDGNLLHYQWSEKDQGTAVVEPKDEFLIEHVSLLQPAKSAEQPFILPASTLILDDYFFSQREVLLWRYLATQCHPKVGDKGCSLTPAQFGVIVPRQQTSMQVSIVYAGQQKINLKGEDRDLSRFELSAEGNDWVIWMDEAYKIQKIAIEADHTEVYRD